MMADIFRFPRHNTGAGCCWACKITPADIRRWGWGSNARWRREAERLSHWECLARMPSVSPIFGIPGVVTSLSLFDWLHCADQGVGADFLGNVCWLLMLREEGNSLKTKCSNFFLKIDAYYQENDIPRGSRLPTLTPTMLRKKATAAPKLRASAAAARYLVKFAAAETAKLSDAEPLHAAVKQAAVYLQNCYASLSAEHFDAAELQTVQSFACCTPNSRK